MKVLVVGSGGREHALCWKIAQSPLLSELLCAPGNAGSAAVARNVAVDATDVEGLVRLAREEAVDLVVVGPEDPLCMGLADELHAAGIDTFGPTRRGAELEGSKAFAKDLLDRSRIPTATWRQFDRSGPAKAYLESCQQWPQVVKADGLAAGKGVFICADATEACRAVDAVMEEKRLGEAGARVVIEEFLEGEEATVQAITDGEAVLILEPVVDHKQVGEGDEGPNTGGMGVYSPAPSLTRRLLRQIEQRILIPAIHGLRTEGVDFRGVLYAGLMITEQGPKVLEFNVRFGDPEAQAVVRRFKEDLLPYLLATAQGTLGELDPPEWDPRFAVGVVGASEGYPGVYRKGDAISGTDAADTLEEVVTFHAGTTVGPDGLQTSGGRVLCVTALGDDIETARERAYGAYDAIEWSGKFCRRDIGTRVEARKERISAMLEKAKGEGSGSLEGVGAARPALDPAREGA
ncbi:MAG: phosphoribosylamine--glycine ligase [Planctomycetota bacterium]|jgi:phosphoribosylamine--glycine ligase|nr:phosphoribosylamine--glycine ligase [Planctomycetota bacterium]MDP6762886.1 phosphoribosylamine--glycine ligase [Planctomycetota bacterium]MDP6988411.1 phosphoribosylamine--glycine ligase [Planctomycetota bacterium]